MIARLLVAVVKLLVGAYPRWQGNTPSPCQRIYFANHASHLDTLTLWAALPPALRARTRPVAAADYWGGGGLKGLIAGRGLNAVLIDRQRHDADADPLAPLHAALAQGDSLILFPEGTRREDALPGPFKSGLFHLARRHPTVELVPVYLDNARRCLPKGSVVPVPLICTARFGVAIAPGEDEDKAAFLQRARDAVAALA